MRTHPKEPGPSWWRHWPSKAGPWWRHWANEASAQMLVFIRSSSQMNWKVIKMDINRYHDAEGLSRIIRGCLMTQPALDSNASTQTTRLQRSEFNTRVNRAAGGLRTERKRSETYCWPPRAGLLPWSRFEAFWGHMPEAPQWTGRLWWVGRSRCFDPESDCFQVDCVVWWKRIVHLDPGSTETQDCRSIFQNKKKSWVYHGLSLIGYHYFSPCSFLGKLMVSRRHVGSQQLIFSTITATTA